MAGFSDLYPDAGFEDETVRSPGESTKNGAGLFGAHVVAFNPATGALVGGFELTPAATSQSPGFRRSARHPCRAARRRGRRELLRVTGPGTGRRGLQGRLSRLVSWRSERRRQRRIEVKVASEMTGPLRRLARGWPLSISSTRASRATVGSPVVYSQTGGEIRSWRRDGFRGPATALDGGCTGEESRLGHSSINGCSRVESALDSHARRRAEDGRSG